MGLNRWMHAGAALVAGLMSFGCGDGEPPASVRVTADVSTDFAAAGPALPGALYAAAGSPDTVVAVGHFRGSTNPDFLREVITAPVDPGGSFDLELSTDRDWVLLLIDSDAPIAEKVCSYITVPAKSDTLVDMPISGATGDVELGRLTPGDLDEAVSDRDTDAISNSFRYSSTTLDAISLADSSFKGVANDYLNFDAATDVYYQAGINFGFRATLDAIVTPDPVEYAFTGAVISVFTNDPQMIDQFDGFCDESVPLAVRPGSTVESYSGAVYANWNPFSNGGMTVDSGGTSCGSADLGLHRQDGVVQLSVGQELTTTGRGYWSFHAAGEPFAAFDFEHSLPVANRQPTVPTPVPTLQRDRDGVVSGATVDWYLLDPATGQFAPVAPADLEPLIATSFVSVSGESGEAEAIYPPDDAPITSATFDQPYRLPTEPPGRNNIREIKVGYTMGGNGYGFIWTVDPFCGDRQIVDWIGELCDRDELGGQTCESIGHGPGTLACSDTCEWDVAGCEPGLSWTWQETGSMSVGRVEHAAVRLDDGRVLVAGGKSDDGTVLASAELYDPVAGTFSPTGSLAHARFGHTLTALADGRVLAAGGFGPGATEVIEVYDPGSGTFSAYGTLSKVRAYHTASYFEAAGRVVFVGGESVAAGSGQADGEWFDVINDQPMGVALALEKGRTRHTAHILANGALLIVGGHDGTQIHRDAEILEPGGLDQAGVAPTEMMHYRWGHAGVTLPDGELLIVGGRGSSSKYVRDSYGSKSFDLFFEDQRYEFTYSDGMLASYEDGATATLLPSGHVVAAGDSRDICNGSLCGRVKLYYPMSRTWSLAAGYPGGPNGAMVFGRDRHRAVLLADGNLLIVGGRLGMFGAVTSSAELMVIE